MNVKTGKGTVDPMVKQDARVPSAESDVAAFLQKAKEIAPQPGSGGRLVFALDATMSRQPTWDQACQIQAEMFQEAGKISGLSIKLVYFRGFGECRASRWFSSGTELAQAMSRISCQGAYPDPKGALGCLVRGQYRENCGAGLCRRLYGGGRGCPV